MATPSAYFDTSVVVKRYINEPSSIRARELFRRFRLLSSAVIAVELGAAIRRRVNLGDITDAGMTAALRRINDDRVRWDLIDRQREAAARVNLEVVWVG